MNIHIHMYTHQPMSACVLQVCCTNVSGVHVLGASIIVRFTDMPPDMSPDIIY